MLSLQADFEKQNGYESLPMGFSKDNRKSLKSAIYEYYRNMSVGLYNFDYLASSVMWESSLNYLGELSFNFLQ